MTAVVYQERTHLVRVIPSETAGPHGFDTLCGRIGTWMPTTEDAILEFGPGFPTLNQRPPGMCITCWKSLCQTGVWARESWSVLREPTGHGRVLPPRLVPFAKDPGPGPDPRDQDIWKLEVRT